MMSMEYQKYGISKPRSCIPAWKAELERFAGMREKYPLY